MTEKRKGGLIDEYAFIPYSLNSDGSVSKFYCIGTIFEDSYWPDNSPLRTSLVVSASETTLETLNTVYRLGKKSDQADKLWNTYPEAKLQCQ